MVRNFLNTPSSAEAPVASSTSGSLTLSPVSSLLGDSFASGEVQRHAARSGEGRAGHGDSCQASVATARKTAAMIGCWRHRERSQGAKGRKC